jgi:glycine cleavage system H lipoate-binding protein
MTDLTPVGPYDTKALEYLVAIAYLVLFVPFWRFVMKARPAGEKAPANGWFPVPGDVHLHPGHTWLRKAPGGTVTLGLDDFGHRLVGPLETVELPEVGARLAKDDIAFAVSRDGRRFPLRSPVSGRVVAVNEEALKSPDTLHADPYRSGWLVRVVPRPLAPTFRPLLSAGKARRFLDEVVSRLSLTPELGALAQDGGTPVHGFATELEPERWDRLVRLHFLEDGLDLRKPAPRRPARRDRAAATATATAVVLLLSAGLAGTAFAADPQTRDRLPRLPSPVALPQGDGSPGAVLFDHRSHVDPDRPDCLSCHPRDFSILRKSAGAATATTAAAASTRSTAPATRKVPTQVKRPVLNHEAMAAGRLCGSCHDGSASFGLDDCTRCHRGE